MKQAYRKHKNEVANVDDTFVVVHESDRPKLNSDIKDTDETFLIEVKKLQEIRKIFKLKLFHERVSVSFLMRPSFI